MHKIAAGREGNFAGVSCRGVSKCGIIMMLPSYTGNREEVDIMSGIVTSFLVSLAAGIACYYICRWLDRHN